MRKITQEAIDAFTNKYNFHKGNTSVEHSTRVSMMYLHGNCIARLTSQGLEVNHQGYITNTTKERLNGIPGVHIQQKNFIWYLNGKEMLDGWNKI
jgi:hypothetical protein